MNFNFYAHEGHRQNSVSCVGHKEEKRTIFQGDLSLRDREKGVCPPPRQASL